MLNLDPTKKLRLGFLAIGDELLNGRISDVLSAKIASLLGQVTDRVANVFVADDEVRIDQALHFLASQNCEMIIVSGGLGPTKDDITRQAVAKFLGKNLVWSEAAWNIVARHFGTAVIPESNKVQAFLPENCVLLENERGSACGFVAEKGDELLIACLPGVPVEFEHMSINQLLPMLSLHYQQTFEHFRTQGKGRCLELLIFGKGESAFEEAFFKIVPEKLLTKYAICARSGLLEVSLEFKNESDLAAYRSKLEFEMFECIVSFSVKPICEQIAKLALDKKIRIGVVETATWGRIYNMLSRVSSCDSFLGGGASHVDLANHFKLSAHSHFSKHFAQALHEPACKLLDANLILMNTGSLQGQSDAVQQQRCIFSYSVSSRLEVKPMQLQKLRSVFNDRSMAVVAPGSASGFYDEVLGEAQSQSCVVWASQIRLRYEPSDQLERSAVAGLVGLLLFLQSV